jgi:hypothetical protein
MWVYNIIDKMMVAVAVGSKTQYCFITNGWIEDGKIWNSGTPNTKFIVHHNWVPTLLRLSENKSTEVAERVTTKEFLFPLSFYVKWKYVKYWNTPKGLTVDNQNAMKGWMWPVGCNFSHPWRSRISCRVAVATHVVHAFQWPKWISDSTCWHRVS